MNNPSENIRILKEGYAKWNESKADSVDYWMGILAEDVQWRSIADGTDSIDFARPCAGKSDVGQYFERVGGEWEMLYYEVDEFIEQGERIVALGRCGWKHRGTGQSVETPKADIFRMKDGKIVEFFEFFDTAAAVAATG